MTTPAPWRREAPAPGGRVRPPSAESPFRVLSCISPLGGLWLVDVHTGRQITALHRDHVGPVPQEVACAPVPLQCGGERGPVSLRDHHGVTYAPVIRRACQSGRRGAGRA